MKTVRGHKRKKKGELVLLVLGFCLVVYVVVHLIVINENIGYHAFKNIEFGTDLEVVVAPHGIYTRKYVDFQHLRRMYDFEDFVSTAENLNVTVYWEGYNGSLFWFYFPEPNNCGNRIGLFYEVPLRWY